MSTHVFRWMRAGAGSRRRGRLGFSLIELLVVMAIIGILAAIGLPRLRGFTRGNAMMAASRQLVDDLALARLKALNSRSSVYVVFLPEIRGSTLDRFTGQTNAYRTLLNVFDAQFAAYAILTERQAGDQPGRGEPRYVTEWRRLPEGVVFVPETLRALVVPGDITEAASRPLHFRLLRLSARPERRGDGVPFPVSGAQDPATSPLVLPALKFNASGQMDDRLDRVLLLTRGSVFVRKSAAGTPDSVDLSYPPPKSGDLQADRELTQIVVNGLTGRTSVEAVPIL